MPASTAPAARPAVPHHRPAQPSPSRSPTRCGQLRPALRRAARGRSPGRVGTGWSGCWNGHSRSGGSFQAARDGPAFRTRTVLPTPDDRRPDGQGQPERPRRPAPSDPRPGCPGRSTPMTIRVLIADDQDLIRAGLAALIGAHR